MPTKYDIHYQPLTEEEQRSSGGKLLTFGYTSALGVKGPQKLVNRWLKCFLTPKGSDPLHKTYGTGYADLIGSNVSRPQDFADAVTLYADDCNQQMFAFDNTQFPPDDERLRSGTVTRIVARGADGYDVYVTLTNVAGSLLQIQVPTGTPRG